MGKIICEYIREDSIMTEIKISENSKYIIVRVDENMTKSLAEHLGIEASNLGKKKHITKFLYDLRNSRNIESINTNYIFAYQEVKKIDLNPGNMVAMLTSVGDNSHNFVETVLRNAGFNVRIFNEEQEALKWLQTESEIM